ncbi:hypothetical protein [Streptomyces noursei]|uniref:hypothetical protein n=1 Tax=Streptomyces noursei TaxID=1971 RepID=UPI001985A2AF|nr:hypothetical protein [Streptomyces noursei]MCZ1013646.1 hypothetical protein [Streptomyces noursei]GGX25193.1 hypothetical protein GCM10010341_52990 [Streptomyces noursei]
MAFGAERIRELRTAIRNVQSAITDAQSAITDALDRSLAGLRATIETTLTAAQHARDAAALAHARTDAIHSELQGLRNDTQRLRAATPSRDDQQILIRLAELHSSVEGLRADLTAVRTPEPPAPPTMPAAQEPPQPPAEDDDFEHLLTLAAGIAYAQIICHRDHWDFLVGQSSRGQHFRLPAGVKEGSGLIHAEISGRTLIAALDALHATHQDPAAIPGTRQLASRIYERIGVALRKVDTGEADAHYQPGNDCPPVTRIIIDDRPPAETA